MRRQLGWAALLLLVLTLPVKAQRVQEVGVVDYYAAYSAATAGLTERFDGYVKQFYANLEDAGVPVEWVRPEIFLPEHKERRDGFKRLVIPFWTGWFTPEMYEGMADYVKSGGLLITQSALLFVDANRNFVQDEVATTNLPQKSFLGVAGAETALMRQVGAISDTPLSRGMPKDVHLALRTPLYGRRARNFHAKVILEAEQVYDGYSDIGPMLTAKNQGRGSAIYWNGWVETFDDPRVAQMVKNIFSEETYEWLVVPEEVPPSRVPPRGKLR